MIVAGSGAHGLLGRVLQPATDVGVAIQLMMLLIVVAGLLWWLRARPEWRLVVWGTGLITLGLMGLRAAH